MLFLYISPVLSKFLVVCWRPSARMVASICAYGHDHTRVWSPANAWKCRRKLLNGWGIFAALDLPNYVWRGVLTSGFSCCNFAKKLREASPPALSQREGACRHRGLDALSKKWVLSMNTMNWSRNWKLFSVAYQMQNKRDRGYRNFAGVFRTTMTTTNI